MSLLDALYGKLTGRRSIRLSKAYRAIYCLEDKGMAEIVVVEEVTKHGY